MSTGMEGNRGDGPFTRGLVRLIMLPCAIVVACMIGFLIHKIGQVAGWLGIAVLALAVLALAGLSVILHSAMNLYEANAERPDDMR